MLITKVAAAGIFTCTASAKLAGWPLLNKHGLVPQQQQQHGQMSVAESNLAQRPLSFQFGDSEYIDKAPYRAGQFTLTLQDGSVCATYGESHWTGTIDVTDSRRLFFSAIESRNDPENDPVVFWMNGGPGGSSMEGHFVELGPCWIDEGANTTVPNAWSWNNNATVVFLDQPAGVGFSSVAPGAKPPGTDIDGAEDFQSFLNVFFSKVFPEKANLPIIIAAESYGGHYGPVYLNHILESRRYGSSSAFNGNITGLILVDAVLDFTSTFIGIYQLLCEDERGKDIITEQECAGMRVSLPECERLGRMCDISKNGIECSGMFFYCQENVWGPYLEKIVTGEKSPYNSMFQIRQKADVLSQC
jgi:cathepsin A (carboxypeptidase C)